MPSNPFFLFLLSLIVFTVSEKTPLNISGFLIYSVFDLGTFLYSLEDESWSSQLEFLSKKI